MDKILLELIITDFVRCMENDSFPYETFCDIWDHYDPITEDSRTKIRIYYICLDVISCVNE